MSESQNNIQGVSLKSVYYDEILKDKPTVDFFEIHAENYMMDAGPHWRYLDEIRNSYDISVHGVGLSLGSAEGIDKDHLARFKTLVDRINPILVSEHLSWSVSDGHYLNDLLPLPYTEESLSIVRDNINLVQDSIGRQLIIENPSTYLAFQHSTISEVDYIGRLIEETGCGLLLDINNVYVSAVNLGHDAQDYLSRISIDWVKEIHLAGHASREFEGKNLLIDDHGSEVIDDVWNLYQAFMSRGAKAATLIERDSNLPELSSLVSEAMHAKAICDKLQDSHVTKGQVA